MDLNPKYQEAMMIARDGVQLTREEEARIQLAAVAVPKSGPGLRRHLARFLIALAMRLDPSRAPVVWPSAPANAGQRPS